MTGSLVRVDGGLIRERLKNGIQLALEADAVGRMVFHFGEDGQRFLSSCPRFGGPVETP
jgi:hypothetical protein